MSTKVKLGQTYKFVSNSNGLHYPKYDGQKCKIIYFRTKNNFDVEFSNGHILSGVYAINVKEISETKEEITKELLELEKNFVDSRTELQNKLQYLEESGSEVFDENEYKVHTTLKTLENKKLSIKEKTKLIASLINQ